MSPNERERITTQQPRAARPSATGAVREHPSKRRDHFAQAGPPALQQALGNAALARWRQSEPRFTLQRLEANQVKVGRTYRYTDDEDGKEKTGSLVYKAGGWYRFDNTDGTSGRAHGAATVTAEVSPPRSPPPIGGAMDVDGWLEPTDDEEHEETDDEEHEETDDDVEFEDAPQPEALPNFAGGILDAGARLGIRDHVKLSVMIELTAAELEDLASVGSLASTLADARTIASCMKTATNLVRLFETGPAVDSGEARRNDRGSMGTTAADLCAAIQRHQRGCLVNVTYGIHGFVVVVWDDHAELLQSFAGESEPETLAANFSNPRVFTRDEVCSVLSDMATGRTRKARADAQTQIAGDVERDAAAVLEDSTNSWPNVEFKWVAYALAGPDVLLGRIEARLRANQEVVEAKSLPAARRRQSRLVAQQQSELDRLAAEHRRRSGN